MRPLFIFSLPRCGSTLLQRILAGHDEIATSTEPWLVLPLFYAIRSHGISAEYGQREAAVAIKEFLRRTQPSGIDAYLRGVADLTTNLYEAAAQDAAYFMDKTPRYHLIVNEIRELFPQSRAVFLWRNPLAAVASMLDTWHRGRWRVDLHAVDLFAGLAGLIGAFPQFSNRAKAIRYEDLVLRPNEVVEDLVNWLGLEHQAHLVERLGLVDLPGTMGDARARESSAIDVSSLEKWRKQFRNPLRQRWARQYLAWLGTERAAVMGYDLDELLLELNGIPLSGTRLPSDIALRAMLSAAARAQLIATKVQKL